MVLDAKKLMQKARELETTPYLHKDHKVPMTRRELLGQGFISMTGAVVMPSFLSAVVSRTAFGAECAASGSSLNVFPYLHVELSGGAAISGNFVFGKQRDGAPLELLGPTSYNSLGLPAEFHPSNGTDMSFGGPFVPTSGFLRGLNQVMSPEAKAKTAIAGGAGTSNDDSRGNPLNGANLAIAAVSGNGNLVQLAGTGVTLAGGRTAPLDVGLNPGLSKVQIAASRDVLNLVDPGLLASRLSAADAARIAEAAGKLSASRIAAFSQKELPAQIKELAECGYINSVELLTKYDASSLGPENDPIVTAMGFNLANANDQRVASIAKLLVDGNAAAGTIERGGYDYHGRGRATQDAQDFAAGRDVGLALELAHRKGVPMFVAVTSDGSVSFNGRNAASDSGARGAYLMIAIGATARPEMNSYQVGAYSDAGAVDTSYLDTAGSPRLQAMNIVNNYAAVAGKSATFDEQLKKAGVNNPFAGKDIQYLAFKSNK
jgi:hypothetical protein